MKVRDVMSVEVLTLGADDPIVTAEELMGLRRIRHLPVVEQGRLVGLVTHRDLMRGALADPRDRVQTMLFKARTTVRALMHQRVRTIHPDEDLAVAAELVAAGEYGCLPVVEDGRLVGIVTEADFLRLTAILLRRLAERDPDWLESVRAELATPEPLPAPEPPPWRRPS